MATQLTTILEIDKGISDAQAILSSLPQIHPHRSTCLSTLAMIRLRRYTLTNDERDLYTSILQSAHAIYLPFQLAAEGGPNLIESFFNLTVALFHHSLRSRQPSDVEYCIKYCHYLRDLSLEAFDIPLAPNDVTSLLVHALALQVQLGLGHAMHNLEEMSVLCHELLASDASEPVVNDTFVDWALTVTYVTKLWNTPSRQVIEYLREANRRLPELHDVSFALSYSFFMRFVVTKSNADYEDAITTLDKIIIPYSPADSPNPYVTQALKLAAMLANGRFAFYGNPEHLEDAIFRYRAYLNQISLEDSDHRTVLRVLAELEKRRSDDFGVTNHLQETHSSDSEVIDIPSFSQLSSYIAKSNSVASSSMTAADRMQHLVAIGSMDRIIDIPNIEEAINYGRLLLASLPPTDLMVHLTAMKFGSLLLRAFRRTDRIEYLDESIAMGRDILKMRGGHWTHPGVVRQLITSLCLRCLSSGDRKDFDEVMQLYPIAATETYTNTPDRFKISCHWALIGRPSRHPSTSTAYESAMSLMQDSLVFAPTLEMQHFRLITMRDEYERLPYDYASYQVDIGEVKQAIETLERGRGLLWSEMRGLRTSIDHIRAVDSSLAENFSATNRDLEELTTSASSDVSITDHRAMGGEGMDPFGHLVTKQRKLLQERDRLISKIRILPGFETFLSAPSFDTLRSAAARGPVIIINHCQWRSDILLLLHDSPPSLIPTTDTFYDRAIDLRDQLLAARKKDIDSREYEDALSFVLASLYDLVGRPVIQRFQELNVPEQSRVWWCPTSVFCSLPLHAMGPIRSEGRSKLYFSDLYIPSYTPTISALIEAHKPGTQSFDEPSMVLVAHPDVRMPNALQEMWIVQAASPSVTTLLWEMATPTAALEHLRDHRFAHILCHGALDTGKPFNASFKLHQDTRLTLLDIVRSQLPAAEFAFLSACHTAEVTDGSIADEALHLAAAVQYCGFRSVVGTMWAVADIDGPKLARNFYRSVFSSRREGTPYHERTAEALRDAVQKLRREKMMTLERWVNFVHYGA